ncbi:MAG: SPOR domain-containing protein [Tatlockia sp.]|jgi:cell division protein FtsN
MAREYGRRPGKKSRLPQQVVKLAFSFVCGYLTASVFDFTSLSAWVQSSMSKWQGKKPAVHVVVKEPELPKPKFEFYTLLAKDRNGQIQAVKTAPAPQAKAAVDVAQTATTMPSIALAENKALSTELANKDGYHVQIASFKNRQDAESMKAGLVLKGFEVSVTTSVQQQVTWFRVIVGPFNSRAQAEKTQLALAQNERIKGMVRKNNA